MILGCGVFLGLLTLLLLVLAMAALVRSTHGLTRAGGDGGSGDGGSGAPLEDICAWDSWRLPRSVVPRSYDLSFDLGMEEPYTVEGTAAIELNITQVRQRQRRCCSSDCWHW